MLPWFWSNTGIGTETVRRAASSLVSLKWRQPAAIRTSG